MTFESAALLELFTVFAGVLDNLKTMEFLAEFFLSLKLILIFSLGEIFGEI
jgi:uncharacterized membrane protein